MSRTTDCGTPGCGHEYDVHDIGGVCSFPGCACRQFTAMTKKQAAKAFDQKVGDLIARFKTRKTPREKVESA